MAEKYEKIWKSCLWLIVPSGMIAIIFAVLYVIFTQFYLLMLMGGALGACFAMSQALFINRKQAIHLRQGVVIDETESAEKYEKLSKARGWGFLWGMLMLIVIAAIIVVLKVLDIVPDNAIGIVIGGGLAFTAIYVLYMGYGFFAYRNKAARLRAADC